MHILKYACVNVCVCVMQCVWSCHIIPCDAAECDDMQLGVLYVCMHGCMLFMVCMFVCGFVHGVCCVFLTHVCIGVCYVCM